MKTPREILLARHQAVQPKLDALRKQVLATLIQPADEQRSLAHSFIESCYNCFRVPRFAWGGFAAAWLVILALHFAARDAAPEQSLALTQARPAETLQAVREQKRLLAELTGLLETPERETPRFVPRPRSERRHQLIMV
ncbi:MAG TPA: hypothetical protein VNT99_17840 [Methylomirabilota bacterium]|nr:hypothetical protein [Methylomirabilota bacterium]